MIKKTALAALLTWLPFCAAVSQSDIYNVPQPVQLNLTSPTPVIIQNNTAPPEQNRILVPVPAPTSVPAQNSFDNTATNAAGLPELSLQQMSPTEFFQNIDNCPNMVTTNDTEGTITFLGIDANVCRFTLQTAEVLYSCEVPLEEYAQAFANGESLLATLPNPGNEASIIDENVATNGNAEKQIFYNFILNSSATTYCNQQLQRAPTSEVINVPVAKKPPNHFYKTFP